HTLLHSFLHDALPIWIVFCILSFHLPIDKCILFCKDPGTEIVFPGSMRFAFQVVSFGAKAPVPEIPLNGERSGRVADRASSSPSDRKSTRLNSSHVKI